MRFAIMSFAHVHADGYLATLRSVPGVEVIGFADDDPARGQHFAEQYGLRLFPSYAALLAEQPDGVVICSENANHRPLAEMAAAAGVHVLSEKPLATSVEDAQAMVDACTRAGVNLMIAFPMRFSPPMQEIKKVLEAGSLGRLCGCNTTNQGQLPRLHSAYPRNWFSDKHLAGGGAATDHVVHVADALRWMMGAEVVEVYADLNRVFYASEVSDVETGGLVMLTFDNGVFATVDCSWSRPAVYPTWGGLTMEIVGEDGFVTVDAFKQVIPVYSNARPRPYWSAWGSNSNLGMIEEFVASIQEHRPPAITGLDGLRAVEIVGAVYQSAASGEPVVLSPA